MKLSFYFIHLSLISGDKRNDFSSLATWTASTDSVQGVLEECIIHQLCLLTRLFDQTDRVGM